MSLSNGITGAVLRTMGSGSRAAVNAPGGTMIVVCPCKWQARILAAGGSYASALTNGRTM